MEKILLLDLDGIVIRPRKKYFSEKYSEEYGVPLEDILVFIKGEYKEAAIGKVDIRTMLPKYLEKWGWKGSVDEFLHYWFESEKELDDQIINLVDNLRKQNLKCYLISDNEINRINYVMNELGLKEHFDGVFSSATLGVTKSHPEFYQKIEDELKVTGKEIILWDDDPKNTVVAEQAGFNAFTYGDYGEFVRKMDELFPEQMKNVMAFNTEDFYCDLVLSGKIKVEIVKETDRLLTFYHTRPSWSTHIVIVPKQHIAKLTDLSDMSLIDEIFTMAQEIIKERGLNETNYKIITNGGSFQDSKHLHFHLVSGEKTK